MLLRLLSAVMALSLTLSATKADDNVVRMDDITSVTILAGDQVFLVHADMATTLTHVDHLVVLWQNYQQSLGGGAIVLGSDGNDNLAGQPHVFTASYRDHDNILHQIVTNCAKLTLEKCVQKHRDAVRAMVEVFQPRAM